MHDESRPIFNECLLCGPFGGSEAQILQSCRSAVLRAFLVTHPRNLHVRLVRSAVCAFFVNDTGLLNFRFERVVANSFIQAARMYRGRDFQFGAR